jgi:hypothetical protein
MNGMMGIGNIPVCGQRHESQMEGYIDEIKSKDIEYFEYAGPSNNYSNGSQFLAKKKEDKIEVFATGAFSNHRDGKYFKVKFESDDFSLFKELQDIVDEYNVTKGNGHCTYVDGLPPGIGDRISINYASGEKVYKTSNQFPTVIPPASEAIYNVFHKYVQKHGYDFTTEGSNLKLYDDADEEYVQGTWKGKHFGDEIVTTFEGKNVTITVNGEVTDDNVEYTIFEGSVIPNKLKDGIEKAESPYDYEYFNGVSKLAKKNYFTMVGYFLQDSYSTCDFHNFDKEKPEDEE